LVVFAGDTFDSIDVSQNLLDFYLSEISRLGKIPVFILPGEKDPYQKGSFWEEWEVAPPAENLHLLTNCERPYKEIPDLSLTVYGYPVLENMPPTNPFEKLKKFGKSKYHIAVIYGDLTRENIKAKHHLAFQLEDLMAAGFTYAALGGQPNFKDFSGIGIKAAYSGTPENISGIHSDSSGQVLFVNVEEARVQVEPKLVGSLIWKEIQILMETVLNPEDLKQKITELSGPDVFLKVTMEGLALLEAGIDLKYLQGELQNNFLHLEFADHTRVLPENISEVKVQEKTLLGQYLKGMVDKLNKADDSGRGDLEESLKIGYTLLTGKELW
jgi:DNA repair exonuclease SbcCD nuclease subunit